MVCDCGDKAAKPTEQHPIAVPSEPGFYEAFGFQLEHDYLPVYIATDLTWDEVDLTTFDPAEGFVEGRDTPRPIDALTEYAGHHGPFRKIDPKEHTQ